MYSPKVVSFSWAGHSSLSQPSTFGQKSATVNSGGDVAGGTVVRYWASDKACQIASANLMPARCQCVGHDRGVKACRATTEAAPANVAALVEGMGP